MRASVQEVLDESDAARGSLADQGDLQLASTICELVFTCSRNRCQNARPISGAITKRMHCHLRRQEASMAIIASRTVEGL